jgi:superfamily II DNA/RNA helicase
MRMVCDTPFILDPTCRISPKLEELEGILQDLLEDPDCKIIVFSEWERMVGLVRELAGEMGVEAAWHTGSLPQQRRRLEINRFKNDPACRLFLSTDSGSVGLNLQVASAVINVDLPWNPAKLEQRIARAWRKNQVRSVTVVNLVAEDSIEHSILHLLTLKQAVADGVLDGSGDLASIKMPSGRGAFISRVQAMMETKARATRIVPPEEELAAELQHRHGDQALRIEARPGADGTARLLAVLDLDEAAMEAERTRLSQRSGAPAVELVDRGAWLAMRRLAATGIVQFTGGASRILHQSANLPDAEVSLPQMSEDKVTALRNQADRALRMATVLANGGFADEAPALLAKAFERATAARLAERGMSLDPASPMTEAEIERSIDKDGLPADALSLWNAIRTSAADPAEAKITALLAETGRFLGSSPAAGQYAADD